MCGIGVSMLISIAGIVVGAMGSAKQADYQEGMAKRDAKIAGMKSDDALERSRDEESRHRMQVLRMAGEQSNIMAASGLSLADGTPTSILEDTFYQGELDAEIIRENAAREAWGYDMQAGSYGAQAGLYAQAGSWNVGTSLLSGATSMADSWYQYNQGSDYDKYGYGGSSRRGTG